MMKQLQRFFYLGVIVMLGFLWFNQPKPMATVDIKGLTDEFLQHASRSKLPPQQIEGLAQVFARSLEMGIEELADDYVLLAKRSVVTEELDVTDELRDYISNQINQENKK